MTNSIVGKVMQAHFATPLQKLVAIYLAERCDDDGVLAQMPDECCPKLAGFACTTAESTREAFLGLVQAGIVEFGRLNIEAVDLLLSGAAWMHSGDAWTEDATAKPALMVSYQWAIDRAKAEADAAVGAHIAEGLRKKQSIPPAVRKWVFERDGNACRNCGSTCGLEVDHIVAESKGGTLTLLNLQTLCRPCNARKGAR